MIICVNAQKSRGDYLSVEIQFKKRAKYYFEVLKKNLISKSNLSSTRTSPHL